MKIHIDMDPVPKGRPRMSRNGHTYTPQKTRDAEAQLKEMIEFAMTDAACFDGPVMVTIAFTFKKPKSNKTNAHTQRPDLDNCFKLVTDAMNGIVYNDDSQIVWFMGIKQWGESGGIDIEVKSY